VPARWSRPGARTHARQTQSVWFVNLPSELATPWWVISSGQMDASKSRGKPWRFVDSSPRIAISGKDIGLNPICKPLYSQIHAIYSADASPFVQSVFRRRPFSSAGDDFTSSAKVTAETTIRSCGDTPVAVFTAPAAAIARAVPHELRLHRREPQARSRVEDHAGSERGTRHERQIGLPQR